MSDDKELRQQWIERLRLLNQAVAKTPDGTVIDKEDAGVSNAVLVAHVCQELGLAVWQLHRILVGTPGTYTKFVSLIAYLNDLELALYLADFRQKLVAKAIEEGAGEELILSLYRERTT